MPDELDDLLSDAPACDVCGVPLDGDPDDQLGAAGAGVGAATLCGECSRARDFDELLWEAGEAE